jgi:hypothetical protein
MKVIEIHTVPYDLYEVLKRMPSLRKARLFIRRQVARVEMRNADYTRDAWEGTEILASRQIVRRVDRYRSAEGGAKPDMDFP